MLIRQIVLILLGVLLIGCGGGGDYKRDEPLDLSGWWEMSGRLSGAGHAYETRGLTPISHLGTSIRFLGIDGILEGSTIVAAFPDGSHPRREVYELQIEDDDLLEGTSTQYEDGVPRFVLDMRMVRVPEPFGRFAAEGLMGGHPVSEDSWTAYALVDLDEGSPEYEVKVIDARSDGYSILGMVFATEPPAGPETFEVGMAGDPVRLYVDVGEGEGHAVGGSVTVLESRPDYLRGSFLIDVEGGGTIGGKFTVDIVNAP